LSIIRLPSGRPLTGPDGYTTSHLVGLFYRLVNFLELRIKPIFVFDGEPPPFKQRALEERRRIKREFEMKYIEALEKGDIAAAFRRAVMTAKVNTRIVTEAKQLLDLMGVPYLDAPSEAEAQAAWMVKEGIAYTVASQDYDSLLFGAPRLVLNFAVASKKYYPKRGLVEELEPELVHLDEILKTHKLTLEQLIDIALLIGTDYNEGIRGIGPAKALKIIKTYGDIKKAYKAYGWKLDPQLLEVKQFYLNPPVRRVYKFEWREVDEKGVIIFLKERGFSKKRIEKHLKRLKKGKSLTDFMQ